MTKAQQAEREVLVEAVRSTREAMKAERNEQTCRAHSQATHELSQWDADNLPARKATPARFVNAAARRHGARAQYNEWAARNGKPRW